MGAPIQADIYPSAVAITPDGTAAYVPNENSYDVTPINIAYNTAGVPISVGSGADGIAITPDGTTAYVTNFDDSTVSIIDLTYNTPIATIALGRKSQNPIGIAITPDGKKAYVANANSNNVTPIDLATNKPGKPITVGSVPNCIAITPDGKTAYVTNGGSNSVTPINISVNPPVAGAQINLVTDPSNPGYPVGIAITPDGQYAYVVNQGPYETSVGVVSIISTATNTVEPTALTVGVGAVYIAITPDQAPAAAFTSTEDLKKVTFDASASSSPVGSIAAYAWDFGDGKKLNTTVPTAEHAYRASGSYPVTLTVTNSAGTSTSQVFTGQTVSNNGGPSAINAQTISVDR